MSTPRCLGTLGDVVPVDIPGKGFVLHLARHRPAESPRPSSCSACTRVTALIKPESSSTAKRVCSMRLSRWYAGMLAMCQDGPDDGLRITPVPADMLAPYSEGALPGLGPSPSRSRAGGRRYPTGLHPRHISGRTPALPASTREEVLHEGLRLLTNSLKKLPGLPPLFITRRLLFLIGAIFFWPTGTSAVCGRSRA